MRGNHSVFIFIKLYKPQLVFVYCKTTVRSVSDNLDQYNTGYSDIKNAQID